jgi:hypothetical protein
VRILVPVIVVRSHFCFIIARYVWVTIDTHDEVTYAGIMGMANGCLLLVLVLYTFSIAQYPLREEKSYAWNYLALSWTFLIVLSVLYLANSVWFAGSLAAVATVMLGVGLWRTKFTIVQKTL